MSERDLAFAPIVPLAAQKPQPDSLVQEPIEVPPSAGRMLGLLFKVMVGEMKANREFMAKALEHLANLPIPDIKIDLPKTEINLPEAVLHALERPITVTMPQPTPIEIEVEE